MAIGSEQDKSYAEFLRAMVAAPPLAFYDLNKPTTVSADASSYVLEAVLLQEDIKTKRPVDEKRMPSICVGLREIREIPEMITTI